MNTHFLFTQHHVLRRRWRRSPPPASRVSPRRSPTTILYSTNTSSIGESGPSGLLIKTRVYQIIIFRYVCTKSSLCIFPVSFHTLSIYTAHLKRPIRNILSRKEHINNSLILNIWGGWRIEPCDAKIIEKCMCSYHNNTA